MKASSIVQIHTAVCPECGRAYVSGGTTTTTFTPEQPVAENDSPSGTRVDIRV